MRTFPPSASSNAAPHLRRTPRSHMIAMLLACSVVVVSSAGDDSNNNNNNSITPYLPIKIPCNFVPTSPSEDGPAGWDCSIIASSASSSSSSSPSFQHVMSPTEPSCLRNRRVYLAEDSVGRFMIFDYLRALAGCEDPSSSTTLSGNNEDSSATTKEACTYALQARSKRGNYDMTLSWAAIIRAASVAKSGSSSSSSGSSGNKNTDDDDHQEPVLSIGCHLPPVEGRDIASRSSICFSYRGVTTVENLTHAAWFDEAFLLRPSSSTPAGKEEKEEEEENEENVSVTPAQQRSSVVVANAGLWNLRYDTPRSDVPAGYMRQLNKLLTALENGSSSSRSTKTISPQTRVFWRTTTPVETNPAFPEGYNAALITSANKASTRLWSSSGYRVIDIESMGRLLVPGGNSGNGAGEEEDAVIAIKALTVDGTHFHSWLSTLMMGRVLQDVCDFESTMAITAAANRASSEDNGDTSKQPPEIKSNTFNSSNNNTNNNNNAGGTSGAATATPTVIPYALAFAVTMSGLLSYFILTNVSWLRARLRSLRVAGAAFVFVWLACFFADYVGVLPRVPKEKKAGPDVLFGICGVVIILSLLTLTKSREAAAAIVVVIGGGEGRKGDEGNGGNSGITEKPSSLSKSLTAGPPGQQVNSPPNAAPAADSDSSISIQISDKIGAGSASAVEVSSSSSSLPSSSFVTASSATSSSSLSNAGTSDDDSNEKVGLLAPTSDDSASSSSETTSSSLVVVPAAAAAAITTVSSHHSSSSSAPNHPSSKEASTGTIPSSSSSASASTTPFMSLDLTNELKGGAMVFFLLYHYWDVKLVYNPVRVLVAAFLFLTGYGNFISLSGGGGGGGGGGGASSTTSEHVKPPTLHKFGLSFIRINLLAAILMTAVHQPWMLYYICPLHTFWTAIVYVFFAILPSSNTTRKGLLLKLIVTTVLHLLLFEIHPLRDAIFYPLWPLLTFRNSMYEWTFRVTLDAYAPLVGMWLAFARPIVSEYLAQIAKLDISSPLGRGGGGINTHNTETSTSDASSSSSSSSPSSSSSAASTSATSTTISNTNNDIGCSDAIKHVGMRFVQLLQTRVFRFGCFLFFLLLVHGFSLYPLPKVDYNSLHRFTASIPIVLYIILRNLTPTLAKTYSNLLATVGTCSLDLYLLQFHLWLAHNAKDIIVLFPEARLVSVVVHSAFFASIAWIVSQAEAAVLAKLAKDARKTYVLSVLILVILIAVTVTCPGF